MEFVILLACLLLAAFVDHLITTPAVERNNTTFNRLLSASQIDTFERDMRTIQSFGIEIDVEEDEPVIEIRPQVDIRQQFNTWSQNMRDYDRVRNRLYNPA